MSMPMSLSFCHISLACFCNSMFSGCNRKALVLSLFLVSGSKPHVHVFLAGRDVLCACRLARSVACFRLPCVVPWFGSWFFVFRCTSETGNRLLLLCSEKFPLRISVVCFFQRVRSEDEKTRKAIKILRKYNVVNSFSDMFVVPRNAVKASLPSPSNRYLLAITACKTDLVCVVFFSVCPSLPLLTACRTLDMSARAGALHRRRGSTRPAALAPQGERGAGCHHHLRHPHLRRAGRMADPPHLPHQGRKHGLAGTAGRPGAQPTNEGGARVHPCRPAT